MNFIKIALFLTKPSYKALINLGMLEVCSIDAILLRSLGIGNNLAISYVGRSLLLPFGGLWVVLGG